MEAIEWLSALIFALAWLGYEPAMARIGARHTTINSDLAQIRAAWMVRMLAREGRIMDTNLIGHVLNSASFFASTNLLIMAAAAGLLFGGEAALTRLNGLALLAHAPNWLLEAKFALVVITLGRGLLDFIWAIRQLNYCVSLIGAAPEAGDEARRARYADAIAGALNPALSAFNRGVRAYYFAMAAAAWLIAGWAMVLGALASFALLAWRQLYSDAALATRRARQVLEE
jgi:uncharacterized membrane protein